MLEWIEWIGILPVLGLTGNWRGYRMGGKAIGGASMSTDMKKKFEAARASGNMDQAKALADKAQDVKDAKKAEKAKEAKTIAPAAANNQKELSASDIEIKPVAAVRDGKPSSERNMAYSSDKLYVVIEPTGKTNSYVVYQNDGVAAKKVATIGLGKEQRLKEEIAKRENKLKPRAASGKSQEPVTGVSIAKGLGIKGVRENTKPEVVRKRIESHIAGENAARYLKAGVKSDLPQYKGVSESAARDFAQLVNNNQFSVNGNVSTFDGRGILIADKLVAGGILRPGNNKYIHELTPFGRELAKNVITDLSNGRVKKQADSLYAGN